MQDNMNISKQRLFTCHRTLVDSCHMLSNWIDLLFNTDFKATHINQIWLSLTLKDKIILKISKRLWVHLQISDQVAVRPRKFWLRLTLNLSHLESIRVSLISYTNAVAWSITWWGMFRTSPSLPMRKTIPNRQWSRKINSRAANKICPRNFIDGEHTKLSVRTEENTSTAPCWQQTTALSVLYVERCKYKTAISTFVGLLSSVHGSRAPLQGAHPHNAFCDTIDGVLVLHASASSSNRYGFTHQQNIVRKHRQHPHVVTYCFVCVTWQVSTPTMLYRCALHLRLCSNPDVIIILYDTATEDFGFSIAVIQNRTKINWLRTASVCNRKTDTACQSPKRSIWKWKIGEELWAFVLLSCTEDQRNRWREVHIYNPLRIGEGKQTGVGGAFFLEGNAQ